MSDEDEGLMFALPAKGTITLNQIGAEYKDSNPKSVSEYRSRLWFQKPDLRGKPTSFSHFYGAKNVATVVVSGTVNNYNMDTALKKIGLQTVGIAHFIFKAGGRFGSISISYPSVRSGANCGAAGAVIYVDIEANAYIIGKGGNGGKGGYGANSQKPEVGHNGGDAIKIECSGRTFRINNNGLVAGGGGGGGGGGGAYVCTKMYKSRKCRQSASYYGGGGLGGAGLTNGANGANTKGSGSGAIGGAGGAGGGFGKNGSTGSSGTTNKTRYAAAGTWAGAAGGRAGYALRKTAGTVTYVKVGDMRGTRQ